MLKNLFMFSHIGAFNLMTGGKELTSFFILLIIELQVEILALLCKVRVMQTLSINQKT